MNLLNIKIYREILFLNSALLFILIFSYLGHIESINFDLYFGNLHQEFSDFFLTGKKTTLTHPLWGYGILRALLFNNILLILSVQYLLLILSINMAFYYVRKNFNSHKLFFILIIIGLPLFFFHSQLWPKSITSSLFIISAILILNFIKSRKSYNLYFAIGICSFSLHFRSDYYFLIHIICLFLFFLSLINKIQLFNSFLIIHLMLLPLGLFNLSENQKYLETSSNMGHVLVLGLGQLPNNPWRLTPKDGDETFNNIIKNKFGEGRKSTEVNIDQYLKTTFLNFIINNPKSYFKKVFHGVKLFLLDPFYIGNLGNFRLAGEDYIEKLRQAENDFYNFNIFDGIINLKSAFKEISLINSIKIIITIITKIIGYFFIFSFIIILLKNFKKLFNNKSSLFLFIVISYQFLVSILVFHMPTYNTSILLIYVLLMTTLFNKPKSVR